MTKQRSINRLKESLFPALLLVFSFFGYGPAELWLTNRGSEEMWFSYFDILLPLILLAGAAFIFIMVLLQILPEKIYRASLAVVTAVGILFFIQGVFLPNSYGALNGEPVDWSQYTVRSVYNTAIWLIIMISAVVWAIKNWKAFRGVAMFTTILVLVIQGFSLVAIGITSNGKTNQTTDIENKFLTTDKEYTVSSENNVIVFILDAFDSELMCDLLEKYPDEFRDKFADFTFYHNTSGGATRTKYAIPCILTARTNDTGDTYAVYLKDSFQTSPLFQELRTGKYDSGIYTDGAYVDRSQSDAISNLSSSERIRPTSRKGLTFSLLKMTAFKYMPHVLKPYFWMYSFELSQWKGGAGGKNAYRTNDIAFYNDLKNNGISVVESKPCFRFFHLQGPHGPITMDENIQPVSSAEGSKEMQGLGSLRIVAEYLQQLKQYDIYDNATVFIMADHGDSTYGKADHEQNPLFMVKTIEKKEFSVSDAKLSFFSVSRMLADALKGKLNMDDYYWKDEKRLFYVGSESNNTYTIYEYASEGDAYDAESWYATGNDYKFIGVPDFKYIVGTKLYSGVEGGTTACQYFVKGFTQSESTFVWTSGTELEMRFDIEEAKQNLSLAFDYCDVGNKYQRCYVYAADNLIGSHIAQKPETQRYIIPKEDVVDGVLNIKIYLPDAYCPFEHGTGEDKRKLGLAFQTVTLNWTDIPFDLESQMQVELPEE